MLAVIQREHAKLKTQASEINDEGAVVAQMCKRLHNKCPLKAVGLYLNEYLRLLDIIEAYDKTVTLYRARAEKVKKICENFENQVAGSADATARGEYLVVVGLTTDINRWYNNTKKLLVDIAAERKLALTKLPGHV